MLAREHCGYPTCRASWSDIAGRLESRGPGNELPFHRPTVLPLMLALLALMQIAVPASDASGIRPITQLLHTQWTAEDGAPANITALAQTLDGYLWLGTWSRGLYRFDGVRFVPFVPQPGDSVPGIGVADLLATSDGSLWIVWGGGPVSRIREGRIESWAEQDGLSAAFSLAESASGVLVAGTANGIARFDGDSWQDVSSEWGYPDGLSQTVWFDRDGYLWAQASDRVIYLPPGGRQFVDPGWPLVSVATKAAFDQAEDGTIWIAELGRSAHTMHRADDRTSVTEVQVGSQTLLIDRKGSLWVGSLGDGLRRVIDPARIRGRRVAQFGAEAEMFGEQHGLLSDVVDEIFEDREGGIWVATSRGLERFRESALTPFATTGSFRARTLWAGPDSTVWTYAMNESRILGFGPRGSRIVQTDFIPTTLHTDASGTLWTVDVDRIYRLRGDRFESLPVRSSNAVSLSGITIDPAGTVWVFDGKLGLLRLSGDVLEQVADISHPVYGGYVQLFSDSRGRIWVGQYHQVALYERGQLRIFDPASSGAPPGTHHFTEDSSGDIWVAGSVIAKLEGDRFRAIAPHQVGGANFVFGLEQDNAGAWWIVTDIGLIRVPRGELDRAVADSSYVVAHRVYDGLDGLPGAIVRATNTRMIASAPDDRIWVAADGGLASVDPQNLARTLPPPVLIETLRLDGRELLPSQDMRVAAGTRTIEIDYTAMTLANPERVRFRYRLESEDRTWQEVGTRRRAYYTQLPPGTHRFHVTASSDDGVWNDAGAVLTFRVLPAWYQTLGFRLAVILVIGGIGASAAALLQRRRHVRSHEALSARYEATMAERTRIAQDLHDTLLQGFAGVALQLKTAELALPDRPDVAAETLVRVQRLTRESLLEARERVWEIHGSAPGGRYLPDALEASARDRTAGTGIEVAVITTGERRLLNRRIEDAAFHIAREAVANAVKHADARRIEIRVAFGATTLGVEVCDDGRGIPTDQLDNARLTGHFGLSGIRDRAERAGGRCDVLAPAVGGTVVVLELPLSQSEPD